MERIIFHIDVNSAFLSWEAVEILAAGGPDIRLIPSIVGGDKDSRRSIVAAKSIPAKRLGINTAEPVSMAIKKCPDLLVIPPHFPLYREKSKAFISICRSYCPLVEQFSIDECFMDMSNEVTSREHAIELACQIKDKIKSELKFTVNVGIGNNKLLAKMASDFEKPDKVHTLFSDEISRKMWPLPVRDLLFVGKASAERLYRNGVKTVGDLATLDLKLVQGILGEKGGLMAHSFANGIDDSPVSDHERQAKGYSHSVTLEENVTSREDAHKILEELVESVARKMRRDEVRAYCVGVTIRSDEFVNRSHQRKLYNATDVSSEIIDVAKTLFDELWDEKTPLRLLNVSLTDVTKERFEQLSLFGNEEKEKSRELDRALDDIRNKYGIDSVKKGMD